MSFRDLFRPACQHSDARKRQKAVKTLTDQAVLHKMAMFDSAPFVRIDAAVRLADKAQGQSILATIAKTHWMLDARRAALAMLTDQAVLSEIASTDGDPYMRDTATKKLATLNMNYCDLCKAPSMVGNGEWFTVDQLKSAVSSGYRPEHRGVAGMLFAAVGVSRSNELISEIMSRYLGYAVCVQCSRDIKHHLP